MPTTLAALAPVFALILLGHGLKRARVFPDTLWEGIEALVYRLLLPALLIVKLGDTDLSGFDVAPMAAAMAAATLAVAAAVAAIRPVARIGRPLHTSILQGAIRQNSYIGLAVAGPLYGASGQALAAVGIAAVIPMVNVISMWSLARLGPGAAPGIGTVARRVATSPIVVACAIGLGANAAGTGLPRLAADTLDLLGRGALPLGLLAVGAGLDFAVARRAAGALLLSNGLKLLAVPSLTALFCHLGGVDPTAAGVAVLFAALPSSASSYVMSRQFGGDHEAMAAILTTQTMMAAATIPAMLALFG